MKILYMNNYRGFQQTYVPLTDVTFLLGENSSGKTSVLSLIQLLSKQEFWFFYPKRFPKPKIYHHAGNANLLTERNIPKQYLPPDKLTKKAAKKLETFL